MSAPHTAGPWRWEFNQKHKSMTLVGGKPQFDLTIMDFARWGMGGAVAVMRDTAHDGFNIMHRVCDRPDWITPFENRKHHADWCSSIIHPDMRLMAAAPDLLEALKRCKFDSLNMSLADLEFCRAAYLKATGGATMTDQEPGQIMTIEAYKRIKAQQDQK